MILDLECDLDDLLVLFRSDFDVGDDIITENPVELAQFFCDAGLELRVDFHAFAIDVDLHVDRSLLIRFWMLSRCVLAVWNPNIIIAHLD